MEYRKYPNLVRNNFWPWLFSVYPLWKIIFKAPNLEHTYYFSGNLEEEKVLELR